MYAGSTLCLYAGCMRAYMHVVWSIIPRYVCFVCMLYGRVCMLITCLCVLYAGCMHVHAVVAEEAGESEGAALEFFNSLDSLDEALKALNYKPIFTKVHGGSLADQKICNGCPHRSVSVSSVRCNRQNWMKEGHAAVLILLR